MSSYRNIAATGTGVIASGRAILWTINVNTAAASAVLKVYDGTSSGGTLVAQVDASAQSSHAYGVQCPNGIYWDLSGGNAHVTIGYA